MKAFFSLLVAVSLAIPTIASAINIDGDAEAAYGSAIATQQLGTAAGVNTYTNAPSNQGIADGSELDAAYGFVSNGVLYLVMAGNFDSYYSNEGAAPGYTAPSPNDYLNLFFMTNPNGTDHTLGTNYTATYNGRINNMGVGGNGRTPGAPGLTFDTGFTPNYWIGANVGEDESFDATNTMFVDYMLVCSNCPSSFLGSVTATNLPPNNVLLVTGQGTLSGIEVSLDNSNTNGVDGTTCITNAQGAAQSVAAATVRKGMEFSIPLVSIGSPTGQVSICAFITDKFFETMYNQVLGPVTGGPGGCQSFLGTAGDPSTVVFTNYPGQHFFSIPVPPCDVIMLNASGTLFASTGGVGSVTAQNAGGCPITVTTSTNWFSITTSGGLTSGNGSFTFSVSSNTSSVQTRTGQFIISDMDALGNIVTQTVTITELGVPAPPLGIIAVDGTADLAYGCPLAVQQIGTQFGNSENGSLSDAVGGSELDVAYGIVQNNVLFLCFAGNLEGNGNKLDVFLQTGPGGQNTLTNVNPNQAGLTRMGYQGAGTNSPNHGLTFGAGFAPNYCLMINDSSGILFVDYAQLWPGGTNALGVATNGFYLGQSTPTNGTLLGGTNPFGVQVAINDSNTNGVDGTTGCITNTLGQLQSTLAAPVTTGVELAIPLGAIGSPTGTIEVVAFVNSGDQSFLSNQILPPVGSMCQGNFGESTAVVLTNLVAPYLLVGPEQRITGIAKSGNNINVSWQTEANSNFVYQLQSTHALTTNTVWGSVGSPTNGTGAVITQTDPSAATNRPGLFYRVQQTPVCP